MKREILFRGQSVNHGSFEYGDLITAFNAVYIGNTVGNSPDDWCKVHPETVGQYIGQTDSKGTKVFEGDILEVQDGVTICNTVIYWDEELCGFFDRRDFDGDSFTHYNGDLLWVKDYKIIGNIHETT